MTIQERFRPASLAALVMTGLTSGAASAHAGEAHVADWLADPGGPAVVVGVMIASVAYWLAMRADRRPTDLKRPSPAGGAGASDAWSRQHVSEENQRAP